MMPQIPLYKPLLGEKEKKYVMECMESTWISSKGSYIKQFEESFANYIGVKFATTVANGTVALHLALAALGIGPGDEIIVPTLTFVATVNAISYTGATPIFADSLRDTWQLDPEDVRRKISSRTRGIMVVHLYGYPADMDTLNYIAKEYGLYLIEDCAEAIGSRFKNRLVGSIGDVAAFSFYGNKTITTGEGGMVVTNCPQIYERALHLKGQGQVKNRQYWHDVIGFNYRMTNICAAIGLAQLEKLNEFINKKRQLAYYYQKVLEQFPLQFHSEGKDVFHTYWLCSVLVSHAALREPLRNFLAENGIETRPVFYPIHTMPMYSKSDYKNSFTVAKDISCRGINLPSWPGLSTAEIEFIGECINQFFKSKGEKNVYK